MLAMVYTEGSIWSNPLTWKTRKQAQKVTALCKASQHFREGAATTPRALPASMVLLSYCVKS